jgi:hypothetical protein
MILKKLRKPQHLQQEALPQVQELLPQLEAWV